MCGIHLIVDKHNRLDETAVERMLAAGRHRGPDASAWAMRQAAGRTVWLGANRLKITDLRDAANQPMQTPDGRFVLTFNGAVYNHGELRRRLPQVPFATASDTETILHLLARHGPAALDWLDGMFALAFCDTNTGSVLLARDRWGIKPLHWFENESFLVVSSEIGGVLASGLVEKRFDETQVAHYLAFRYVKRPATFLRDIAELEPGVVAASAPQQRLRKESRLFLPKRILKNAAFDRSEAVGRFGQILLKTVRRHCQADVPVGLLLSGGVDSTLLLALAHEAGVRALPAFTIAYAGLDEAYATQDHRFARQAARLYGAEAHEVTISEKLLETFPDWVRTLDQPVADGAAWLTSLLAAEAKPYATVLLSGAGADELFAGYNRHWAFYQYLKYHRLLRRAAPLLATVSGGLGRHWRAGLSRLRPSAAETFVRFTAATDYPIDALPNLDVPDESGFVERHLSAALRFDQTNYLPADVLAVTDRMTMCHGVEARLPYLSHEVVDFSYAFSAGTLLKHGQKWLLKELLLQRGGQPHARRRKEGFGMPLGRWLRGSHGGAVTRFLENHRSPVFESVDYAAVQDWLKTHRSGIADHTNEIWALAVLAAWMET
ncbi:MAG: asparagine synthase (glutamine-hydrolyzing) [Cytophagales bacterium]|jgi:asparagine synthase (glutamine-hydrolysing)|nr:asparagine synthase (glutamine-hydrolyzing) [Cytophagales bacterium]